MADHDHAAARREITDALITALDRRHEVLDVIVDSEHRGAAVEAVAELLGTTTLGAEAVVGMPLYQLTKDSRRRIKSELDDLNSRLTFTLIERPESSGQHLVLRPFSSSADRNLFGVRTAEIGAAGDGSGGPAGNLDDEISAALGRIHDEDAVWLVAEIDTQTVGMVFGELLHGEVNVRIWIHPDHRKRGYGTAALRKARSEMAGYFPAVPVVVRAPGAAPA